MRRRLFITLLPAVPLTLRGEARPALRGRLRQDSALPAALLTAQGEAVLLEGDRESMAVLGDDRLKNDEFELHGEMVQRGRFRVDAIHNRAIFVWRKGRKLVVTYWCEVCSIRAWTPGKCQCCQDEMALDPRDPSLKDTDPSN